MWGVYNCSVLTTSEVLTISRRRKCNEGHFNSTETITAQELEKSGYLKGRKKQKEETVRKMMYAWVMNIYLHDLFMC